MEQVGRGRRRSEIPFKGGESWAEEAIMRRWLTLERVALGIAVFVGLALVQGHGWEGFAALFGVACLAGAILGLIGRRYPMIYAQNRRDRRRRQRSYWQSRRDREGRRSS